MNRSQAIADLELQLKRCFIAPEFDDPNKKSEICGLMPDWHEYQERRNEMIAAACQRADAEGCLKPTYDQPLLSKYQELHLARQYNFYKYLARNALANGDLKKAQGLLESKNPAGHLLSAANARLAVNLAKKLKVQKHFEDLVSESYVLCCRCVDYFDWTLGNKFSTYFTWAARKSLGRLVGDWVAREEHQPQADEVDVACLPSRGDESKEEQQDRRRKELVNDLLELARPREAKVLAAFFLSKEKTTLKEISLRLHISKERVRQVKARGIRRIQQALKKQGIEIDVEEMTAVA